MGFGVWGVGGAFVTDYHVAVDPDVRPEVSGNWYLSLNIATQRATKGFLAPERPKVRYLIRSNPPYVPTVLPTSGPWDYSLGLFKNNIKVRSVACP